jgi:glycosyltransferase involved in cell wall biosynthesis
MIVHVGPSRLTLPARLGGAVERRMLELAQAQARSGEEVVVYSGGAESGRREFGGVTLRYLSGPRTEFALSFVQDAVRRAARVIHVHNRAEIAWLAKAAGLGPVVLSCDYHFEPWRRLAYLRSGSKAVWRRFLGACDRIAPVSEYCREVFGAYWDLRQERLETIANGVDCARFRPDGGLRASWRARLGIDGRPLILYVGRLCEQKGTDLLIAAYRMLQQPAALVLAGPCGQFGATRLSALVEQAQAAGAVYLPPVDDAELQGLYNACDLFVMPTRELEMFGMAAVEAQACGKPVIASDHGGLRETVPDCAGSRFRSGDAAELCAHIERAIGDGGWRAVRGEGGRKNAARYDWPRIVERCEEVYARL